MKSIPPNQIPVKQVQRIATEVLASAILEIFPGAFLVAGKETDLDFYYDFQFEQPLMQETLFLVEERMRGIIKENLEVEMMEMMRQNAMELFRHQNQQFKIDELELIRDNIVQVWKMGNFYDVCKPPYGSNTNNVQAFKLQKVEKKTISFPYSKSGKKQYQKLQVIRVSGTAWSSKAELKDFLKKDTLFKKRDHRLLGLNLGLFSFDDEIFPNDPCWLPKGQLLRDSLLNNLKKKEEERGFSPVKTPNFVRPLFLKKTSPLSLNDADSTRIEIEGDDFACVHEKTAVHAKLFAKKQHLEKDLPVRYSEIYDSFFEGDEASLDGLYQTRIFLTDQAHIFCSEAQVEEELISSLQLIDQTVRILGLKIDYVLKSKVKPYSSKGSRWLENGLNGAGFQFIIDKEIDNIYAVHGKGLNHQGPKIEVEAIDDFGRRWLIASLGIDLATSGYLGLNYLSKDGQKEPPVIIVRSVFNSLERFIALLIEQNEGA